jgi:hypothetical protein
LAEARLTAEIELVGIEGRFPAPARLHDILGMGTVGNTIAVLPTAHSLFLFSAPNSIPQAFTHQYWIGAQVLSGLSQPRAQSSGIPPMTTARPRLGVQVADTHQLVAHGVYL